MPRRLPVRHVGFSTAFSPPHSWASRVRADHGAGRLRHGRCCVAQGSAPIPALPLRHKQRAKNSQSLLKFMAKNPH
jgi:hypothetical protein